MTFTEKEKILAAKLKEMGLTWAPEEGDSFWALEDYSHQFYLGESLPSSFSFQKGETYVFDSSMTWHIQQGGLDSNRFVWLPSWAQCREHLRNHHFSLELHDHQEDIHLQAKNAIRTVAASGKTDLEAMYLLLLSATQSEKN